MLGAKEKNVLFTTVFTRPRMCVLRHRLRRGVNSTRSRELKSPQTSLQFSDRIIKDRFPGTSSGALLVLLRNDDSLIILQKSAGNSTRHYNLQGEILSCNYNYKTIMNNWNNNGLQYVFIRNYYVRLYFTVYKGITVAVGTVIGL